MTRLLVKIFIKNADAVNEPKVRAAYGVLSGVVGIVCNIILFAFKFFAGIVTGAVSISADAFNNLSDAGSSVITFIGFIMAGKPADTEHPFGHGRIEYVSGLIVAIAIIVMAYELFTQSLNRIIHPENTVFSVLSVIILIGSILVKMWMSLFNRYLGKKINSAAMLATSTDSLSDCVSTLVVLICLVVSYFTGFNIDGYAGVVVAVFVFMAGYGAAKDTLKPLLGELPEPEFVDAIEKMVMDNDCIIGVHDMIVHNYGPGRVFASVHAEVPYNVDILEAHDIIDLVEQKVKEELGCEISIHMDPVVTDDDEINELKKMTLSVVKSVGEELTMHDFRVTKGPYIINLIFDVVVPYSFKYTEAEITSKIKEGISLKNEKCRAVINIDNDLVRR